MHWCILHLDWMYCIWSIYLCFSNTYWYMVVQGASHFMYTYDCGTSGPYINYREVFARSALHSVSIYISNNIRTSIYQNANMPIYQYISIFNISIYQNANIAIYQNINLPTYQYICQVWVICWQLHHYPCHLWDWSWQQLHDSGFSSTSSYLET